MGRIRLVGLAILLGIAACASPNVKYATYSQDAPREKIGDPYETYLLPKSIVTVSRAKEDGKYVYSVGLTLAGDTRNSFGLRPVDRFGVNTDITVTRIENTALLHSVSIDLEDKRIEYIGDAFKLLGTVAMAITGSSGLPLAGNDVRPYPLEVDTLERLTEANCGRAHCAMPLIRPGESDLAASLVVGDVPPDAIDLTHVLSSIGQAKGILFSSACRQASVLVQTDKDTQSVSAFSLADPRYVQIIPLPRKGTITFHSQCGFNVASEKVDVQSNALVADAILQDVKKLLDAMQKDSEATNQSEEKGK